MISLHIYILQLIAENVTLSFDRLQGLFICGQHHTSPYTIACTGRGVVLTTNML